MCSYSKKTKKTIKTYQTINKTHKSKPQYIGSAAYIVLYILLYFTIGSECSIRRILHFSVLMIGLIFTLLSYLVHFTYVSCTLYTLDNFDPVILDD